MKTMALLAFSGLFASAGAMTFALPEGAGCWRVRLREEGTVCRLDWQEACPGLAILFK